MITLATFETRQSHELVKIRCFSIKYQLGCFFFICCELNLHKTADASQHILIYRLANALGVLRVNTV